MTPLGRASRSRLVWAMVGINALLAILAYRGLLTFRPHTGLVLDAESFFFEPSDTSPPVILILVLWLAMRRFRRFRALQGLEGPRVLTALLLVSGFGAFVWALRLGAPDLQVFSLLLDLMAFANWLGGPAAMRIGIVPATVLLFALPMPAPLLNQLVWTAQIWTTEYTGLLLYALSMPALVSGDQILRSDQVFAVIETCSGLRSVETMTLLAVLMVDLFGRHGRHAVLLVLLAPPIAFFINGFRVLGLILNPHSEIAVVHNAQGILMLLAGVLVLYGIDGLLARWLPGRPRAAPTQPQSGRVQDLRPRLAGISVMLLLTLGLTGLVDPWEKSRGDAPLPSETIPAEIGGWRSKHVDVDWLFLGKTGFRQALHRVYARRGEKVMLFVGTEAPEQRYRSLLSPKTGLPGSGWIVEDEWQEQADDRRVTARVVRKGTKRLLVHHWYQGTGGLAAETLRNLLGFDASPFRRRPPSFVVRLATPVRLDATSRLRGGERLLEFSRRMEGPLKELSTPRGNPT